jgi:hypothetical protein
MSFSSLDDPLYVAWLFGVMMQALSAFVTRLCQHLSHVSVSICHTSLSAFVTRLCQHLSHV